MPGEIGPADSAMGGTWPAANAGGIAGRLFGVRDIRVKLLLRYVCGLEARFRCGCGASSCSGGLGAGTRPEKKKGEGA